MNSNAGGLRDCAMFSVLPACFGIEGDDYEDIEI
jgi:hypothetical protein